MRRRSYSLLVENNPGVTSRISGLLSRRGFTMESISAVVTADERYSRVTVVASGDEQSLEQIEKQLAKLEDVIDIKILRAGASVTRELILVKIRATDVQRQAIMNVTEIFHGKVVDVTLDSMVIELTGHQDKLEAFMDLLQGYEILELARTGITGLSRGTVYKVYVSWSSSTVGEGNYDYTTIKTWVMTKWSWASSNGKATSAQTRLARDAINNQGSVSDFSYLVWNDLVEKINEAVCEYGYDWVNHPLRFNKTKMTSTDKTLTADRFNSARYNVGLY